MNSNQRFARKWMTAYTLGSLMAGGWLMVAHTRANDGGGLGDPPSAGMNCPSPCNWIPCGVSNDCRCEGPDSCIVTSPRPVRERTSGSSSQPRIVF